MARKADFEKVFRDAQAACGDVNSEAATRLGRQMQKYGAEVALKNYLNPEGLALSIYQENWRELSVILPQELEKRLINILPSLSEEQEARVREFLRGYFSIAKERCLQALESRSNAKGTSKSTSKTKFMTIVEGKINSLTAKADEAITRSLKTRNASERIRKRGNRVYLFAGIITGIITGVIGSLLAQWIWTRFLASN